MRVTHMRSDTRRLGVLLVLLAGSLPACRTPEHETQCRVDPPGAENSAELWLEAAVAGDSQTARAAELRLGEIVGESKVQTWKLSAALSQWGQNARRIQTLSQLRTDEDAGLLETRKRDALLRALINPLRRSLPPSAVREAGGRALARLEADRLELYREVQRKEQVYAEGSEAVRHARARLNGLDQILQSVREMRF